jgi:hypothetical protein
MRADELLISARGLRGSRFPLDDSRLNERVDDFATTDMIEQDRVYKLRIETRRIVIDGVSGSRVLNGRRYLLDSAN